MPLPKLAALAHTLLAEYVFLLFKIMHSVPLLMRKGNYVH